MDSILFDGATSKAGSNGKPSFFVPGAGMGMGMGMSGMML